MASDCCQIDSLAYVRAWMASNELVCYKKGCFDDKLLMLYMNAEFASHRHRIASNVKAQFAYH